MGQKIFNTIYSIEIKLSRHDTHSL